MFLRLSSRINSLNTVIHLINSLKVKVSKRTIRQCLYDHPDYPSMLSINDCLNDWSIDSNTYVIDKKQFKDVELPAVIYKAKNGRRFIFVENIEKDTVQYVDEKNNKVKLPIDKFVEDWDGIILKPVKSEISGESNYYTNYVHTIIDEVKAPLLIVSMLIGVISLLIKVPYNHMFYSLVLLKMLGCVISVLLLIQNIDSNNHFIKKICKLGNKTNCNNVLNSDAAKITDWLSLSEMCGLYFFGTLLGLLLWPNLIIEFSYFNFLSLPFTFYSIIYQRRVGEWCILCVSVVIILWLECLGFLLNNELSIFTAFSYEFIFPILIFLALIIFWINIKTILVNSKQVKSLINQVKTLKFKNVPDIFTSQNHIEIPSEVIPLMVNKVESNLCITAISNLYCPPCTDAHKLLDELITKNPNFNFNIIFLAYNGEKYIDRVDTSKHFISLFLEGQSENLVKALRFWYNQKEKRYEDLIEKFPCKKNQNTDSVFDENMKWCHEQSLTLTPTILINGYKLPDEYSIDDIKHIFNYL